MLASIPGASQVYWLARGSKPRGNKGWLFRYQLSPSAQKVQIETRAIMTTIFINLKILYFTSTDLEHLVVT